MVVIKSAMLLAALLAMSACMRPTSTQMDVDGDNVKNRPTAIPKDGSEYEKEWYYTEDEAIRDCYEVDTLSSEDGRLTFITWNTGMGGTCPDIRNMIIWRDKKGRAYRRECSVRGAEGFFDETVDGCYVWGIDTIHSKEYGTVYLVTTMYKESSVIGSMLIQALVIAGSGDLIYSVPLFDVDYDICGEMGFEYHLWPWEDRKIRGNGWHGPIRVDPKDRSIYIPIIHAQTLMESEVKDSFQVFLRDENGYYKPSHIFVLKDKEWKRQ